MGEADVTAGRKFIEHRQQEDAKQIIDHGSTEYDLAFGAAMAIDIREYADGDADAGRGQGAADEQRHQQGQVEYIPADNESKNKWEDETRDGDDQGSFAGAGEMLDVGFQADFEQQQDNPDLGQ